MKGGIELDCKLIPVKGSGKQISKAPFNNNIPRENFNPSSRPLNSNTQKRDEEYRDANTSPTNTEHNVKKIFSPISFTAKSPAVNSYRIDIYNSLTLAEKCSIKNPFLTKKSGDLELSVTQPLFCSAEELENAKRQSTFNKDSDCYLGNYSLTLSSAWQLLPSLSSAEKLTHYAIAPATEVEIQYSQRDNQYYIRSQSSSSIVNLSYIIEVPKGTSTSIPPPIKEMISLFKNFGEKALEIDEDRATGEDYIQAIINQKVGSCRHRAIAFFYLMKKNNPEVFVRIITNSCHAKVEFKLPGECQWVDADLGGYGGALNEFSEIDNSDVVEPTELLTANSNQTEQSIPLSIQKDPVKSVLTQENSTNKNEPTQDAQSNTQTQVGVPVDIQTMLSKQLETWKKVEEVPLSVKQYCKKITHSNDDKKYLIDVPNQFTGHAFLLAIKSFCIHTHRRFYYINSPEDLVCSGSYLKNQDDVGYLLKGPGGPLHDFLIDEENVKNPALLLINYQNFDADDLVRFNRIIDDERIADGTPLPQNMILVGVINSTQPDSYQGEDFYSRFDKVEICPFSEQELSLNHPQLLKEDDKQAIETFYSINLYNMPNWQDRLLGRWTIDKDRFYFQTGELIKALENAATIRIQNGPWKDPSFIYFWKQAVVNGFIEYAGKKIALPDNFKIIEQTGYDWESLLIHLDLKKDLAPTSFILNPTLLTSFFSDYELDEENKTLTSVPGILEKNANNTLTVNLTRSLSEDEWAMILTESSRLHIKLCCQVMPGVNLPDCFNYEKIQSPMLNNWDRKLTGPLSIIHSTDCETTIAQICDKSNDWLIMNVSELETSDIITRIDCFFNEKRSRFEFYKTQGILLEALKNNIKVILTGEFSNHFIDNLMAFILSRQTEENPLGTLVIIYDSKDNLFPKTVFHEVTVAEKKEILSAVHGPESLHILSDETFNEGLSRLKARIRFYHAHEDSNTNAAWSGLASLPPHRCFSQFDLTHSKEITDGFIKKRLEQISRVLQHSPYVYLSGLTGVGKSTFVEQYIDTDPNISYYQSEEKLKDWALDSSEKLKVIFIDEANIGSRKWSEFEGLFHNPPGILIDGIFYPLTHLHKVIFAGNPVNYGNDRQIAPLFKNHGNALVFDAMPPEFIYETVLKPIFQGTMIEGETKVLSEIYLSLYHYIVNLSDKEVLISARELQMMALQTLAYHNQFPQEDIRAVAAYYTYEIGRTLVPDTNLKEFSQKFYVPALARLVIETHSNQSNFIVTSSRKQTTNQLNDLLHLRQYRQTHATNEAQKYGGLGGIILEGEPGIGKSEIVINTLITHGFKEGSLDKISAEQNVFYRLLMSMQMDDKKALLLKAFNEGALVIIDEINSSPMMERWLNDVLMGINPLTKQRPKRPGFLIIGTQNPVTMAGRRRPGNALARRLITTVLNPYSKEEMVSILTEKSIEPKLACTMVEVYHEKLDEARLKNLNPAPTFRDLLRIVKNYNLALTKEAMAILNLLDYPDLSEFLFKNSNRVKPYILHILCKNVSTSFFLFNTNLLFFEQLISSNFSEEKIVALIALVQKLQGIFTSKNITEILITAESLSTEDLNVVLDDFETINNFCIENNYKFHHFLNKSKIAKIKVLCDFIKNNSAQGALVINQLETAGCLAKRLNIMESLPPGAPQKELFIRQSCTLTKNHLEVLAGLMVESNEYANSFQVLLDTMLNRAPEAEDYTELFNTLSLFERLGADLSMLESIRNELYQSSPFVMRLLNECIQYDDIGTELLEEIQSRGLFALKAINQYFNTHQKRLTENGISPISLLKRIQHISNWLQQNGEAQEWWLTSLTKLGAYRIRLLEYVLDLSLGKDKSIVLNALNSQFLQNIDTLDDDLGLLFSHCESLHMGTALKHFELSDPIKFSEERASFLKHLEQKTFVTVDSPDSQCWTQEKNSATLNAIYLQYMDAFRNNVDQENTAQLMVIAKELNKANLEVAETNNSTVSIELKNALTQKISTYQHNFWIRKYRRENSSQLSETISQSTNFIEILKAIYVAREEVVYNDTHREKNMHRRGKSRYYDALNEMEQILLQHWTQNPQSLAEFKTFHPLFIDSLNKSFSHYINALNFENKKKNLLGRNANIAEYSADDLETALTPNKSYPGYIHALARELKERVNALKQFESLHENSMPQPK